MTMTRRGHVWAQIPHPLQCSRSTTGVCRDFIHLDGNIGTEYKALAALIALAAGKTAFCLLCGPDWGKIVVFETGFISGPGCQQYPGASPRVGHRRRDRIRLDPGGSSVSTP